MKLFSSLNTYIESLTIDTISEDRKAVLQQLVTYLSKRKASAEASSLNFICIHNSRRSHLAQVWAQTMAKYFNNPEITCFSGGTEATAMYPQVAETLKNVGFKIEAISTGDNPVYSIKYSSNQMPIIGFSKTYDNNFNPSEDFAAVMVCDAAAEACPYVGEADSRMSITYEDPKAFDKSDEKVLRYEDRSRQIATEMKWIFSQLA